MSAIQRKKVYSVPYDGLNDFISPVILRDTEVAELINGQVNSNSLLEKFPGYVKDGSPFPANSSGFIRMLLNLRRGTSVDVLLMAAVDTGNTNANYKVDLKKTSGDGSYSYIGHISGTADFVNGNAAVTGTGSSWLSHLKAGDKIKADAHSDAAWGEIQSVNNDLSITLTAGYAGATTGGAVNYTARVLLHKDFVPQGIVYNNKAIIVNGSERPFTYDNTTISLITDTDLPVGVKFIESHKARIFTANATTLYWSATNDETVWDAASFELIFPQDGGDIVGIKSFADSLIVFKNNGRLYRVLGNFDQDSIGYPAEILKVDVPTNIGIISSRSITEHRSHLYFLSETGVYRVNPGMQIEAVTRRRLDNFISTLNYSLGPQNSKSFAYDTKTQWDNGTHSGTRATSGGDLENYFDEYTITDAKKGNGLCAINVDSSNVVHLAYVDSAGLDIKYKQYATDGTVTSETALTAAAAVTDLSLDVAPNGTVGIAYTMASGGGVVERVASVWGANQPFAGTIHSMAIRYRSDNDPRVGALIYAGPTFNTDDLQYFKRVASVWTLTNYLVNFGNDSRRLSLALTANNPRMAFYSSGTIYYRGDNSDGSALDLGENVTAALTDFSRPQVSINNSNQAITGFGISGFVKKRNHDTTTTSTLDSTSGNFGGYQTYYSTISAVAADRDYWYQVGSTGTEKYGFENSATVSNGIASTVDVNYYAGAPALDNNGPIFASVVFGVNANELLVRRVSFRAIWTSEERHDSTLTAWGTYATGSESAGGNTLTYQMGVNNASPVVTFNTIVPGALISTDPTKNYAQTKFNCVLNAWAKTTLGSITLNYTGSGVDAKQPLSYSFNNEWYCAVAETSANNNNYVIVSDIQDALLKLTYPVSCMERFKNKLYAGLATKGDLLILHRGYNFDGASYSMDCQFKEDFLDSVELEKDIYKAYLLYKVQSIGTLTFSYRLDAFKNNGGAWTDTTVDMSTDGIKEILVGQKARTIQFRVQNSGLDNQVGAITVVLVYGLLNIR